MTKPSILLRPGAVVAAALLSTLTLVLGACATVPEPSEQMAVAEAAVQRASTAGTSESAPAELGVAVAKLAAARSAMRAGDRERARNLADEATLDAQVAESRADAVRSTRAAAESDEAARVLREELSRAAPR